MPDTEKNSMGYPERFARLATSWAGSTWSFGVAVLIVVIWAVLGPYYEYSNTWQLVINTGTTIVTFLMVFLIQRSQNKDSHAVHLKLNELVAAMQGASNRLISVEDLSESEVRTLAAHFQTLVQMSKASGGITESHSIEEAKERHMEKWSADKTAKA